MPTRTSFKHLQISLRHGNTGGYGTPPRLPTERNIRKVQIHLPKWDVYICPEHKYPEYVTTDRNGYKEYKCKGDRCANCPRREEYFSARQERKRLRRHVWEDFKDMAYAFTHTEKGKNKYSEIKFFHTSFVKLWQESRLQSHMG